MSNKEISQEEFFLQRKEQINEAKKEGMEIYPHKFFVLNSLTEILETSSNCTPAEKSGKRAQSAGRISTIRHHTNFSFMVVTSNGIDLQLICSKKKGGKEGKLIKGKESEKCFTEMIEFVKRGDIIGFCGFPGKSKMGEPSLFADSIKLLSPCLRVIPSVKNLLTNAETIYRKRHVDLLVNQESRQRFIDRSRIISFIREFLREKQFLEVETPMMNIKAGGASARPFVTHHNELKMDLHMRVAPELYLKQLVVGGIDRVFEIGKNFRNEGIDLTHNPEFTAIEFYMAYADYEDLMGIVEELLSKLVKKLKNSLQFDYVIKKRGEENEEKITLDFSTPFNRIDILTELSKILNIHLTGENIEDPIILQQLISAAAEKNIEISEPKTLNRVLDAFIGEFIEPQCINPTFVTGFPIAMSPLAKDDRNRPGLTERFEMFVNGKELVNAYTELNMPDIQRERFLSQQKEAEAGDDEAMPNDEDFCQVLEFALPPTGGCGIGIDRLVMYLTNASNIRDVILFPTMKPDQ
ncbi:hypothetical protein NUSPORA_02572 [Nucleospora cyclopteri]